MSQIVETLFDVIVSKSPGIPIVLKVEGSRAIGYLEGGVPEVQHRSESYICLSQLPQELREKVVTTVNYLLRP